MRLALLCAATSLGFAVPVLAQSDADEPAGAVVQQLPSNDSMTLNAALARLGRNPRDPDALIDAGQAALTVGDVDAAIGFFRRAEQVTPGNPRVKAGLARALVRSGNPFDALPLFEEVERAGAMDAGSALDRGLAYDLVANNAEAQKYYRQALAAGPNDEATRRLALSLAIAGDKRTSGTVISPLLLRQDKASWRARAFALAIMGQTEEAITVVNGTLPASLAAGIAPYLRYMPRLTPAQQAAAANFGQFPRASEIGRDDPRVALYAPATGRRPALATADSGLIPKGEPLGRNSRSRDAQGSREARNRARPPEVAVAETPAQRRAAAFPPAPVQPVRQPPEPPPVAAARTPATTPAPALAAANPPVQPPVARLPVQPAPPPAVAAAPAVAPTAVAAASAPPVVTATPAPVPAVAVAAAAAPPQPQSPAPPAVAPAAQPQQPASATAAPVPPTPRRQSLAEAFSDLGRPTADATPASGAVDIRRIRPAREPAAGAASAAPAAPVHPSRIWVQLATGRDKAALGFDFRRMAREAETAFKARRAFVSSWGQTNRLLTGPFDTESAANAFLAQLRRADIDGAFIWTSPAGQVVDALAAR